MTSIVYDIGIYLGSKYNIDIEHDDGYTLIDETIPTISLLLPVLSCQIVHIPASFLLQVLLWDQRFC